MPYYIVHCQCNVTDPACRRRHSGHQIPLQLVLSNALNGLKMDLVTDVKMQDHIQITGKK